MQYTFTTTYDKKALTAMAKCLRKTVRRKRSRRSHALGWAAVALAVLVTAMPAEEPVAVDGRILLTWAVVAVMLLAMLFEDRLNGFIGGLRMLKGTEAAAAVFDTEQPDGFTSETAVGKSEFFYSSITALAETEDYFVFLYGANHAQVYAKSSLQGGTAEEFRAFLESVTGKPFAAVR